jgi:DNA polymerase-3 subunit gamma/tau
MSPMAKSKTTTTPKPERSAGAPVSGGVRSGERKTTPPPAAEPAAAPAAEYTVVARRYRPQQFADLIGQEHVATALVNALQANRVAHAYLFTGARGVGKTSAARILAKALNCVEGPTATPCDKCDSCKAVAAGEDVDVLEIDGASNNKVEEIRDLRQNVGFRPTRSRYKIYIIDEVHMLTTSAFNALLKTLEEPPSHVKFIFATTEVQKIPITILSRCQRFDFAHVGPTKIFEQLKRIVSQEGHQADDEALKLIARRAGGSMRDSQSLLDQLLSACSGKLTAEQVHAVLGTAGDERVTELAGAILNHEPATALNLIACWVDRGLQIGELVDQLIGYWRALMLVSCGGPDVRELPVTPTQKEAVAAQAKKTSLDAILAGLEVWTATRGRMRDTSHTQVLLEMAVVRLCRLDELLSVGQLVQAVSQPGAVSAVPVSAAQGSSAGSVAGSLAGSLAGSPARQVTAPPEASLGAKKNDALTVKTGQNGQVLSSENSTLQLSESALPELWRRLIQYLSEKSPILANHLKFASSPAIFGPNSLAIPFHSEYNHAREACSSEGNTRRIEEALSKLTGQPAQVRFEEGTSPAPSGVPTSSNGNGGDRTRELMARPWFKKASETLGAQIRHIDPEFNPSAPPQSTPEEIDFDPDET